jgi:hypothetical protein
MAVFGLRQHLFDAGIGRLQEPPDLDPRSPIANGRLGVLATVIAVSQLGISRPAEFWTDY